MMILAAVAWESVALVTAILGGGSVGIVKIVKVVKANGAITPDKVKTLVHSEMDPRCATHAKALTEIKTGLARVETRTNDIWELLKEKIP